MDNELNFLASKAGFNTALRHFRLVTRYVGDVQKGGNLADLINLSLEGGEVHRDQVKPILNAVAVDKFQYAYKSYNLQKAVENPEGVTKTLAGWGKVDLLFTYSSPQAGLFVINPKNPAHWDQALPLMKDELVVVYAGSTGNPDLSPELRELAVKDCIKLLNGETVEARKEFLAPERPKVQPQAAAAPQAAAVAKAAPAAQAAAPAAGAAAPKAAAPVAASGGKKRMTPRYGVLVTNELFHNGNVEAWKRVIESYKAKYPTLDVLIWYENERINDINALFKWGKVKHGNPIMISVTGDDIKDVSKLQKYLFEGASPRFEVFLRGAVNRVLDLF